MIELGGAPARSPEPVPRSGSPAGHSAGLAQLELHRQLWNRKPVLQRVYATWFSQLVDGLAPAARVLEIGAGPGFFRAWVRSARPDLRWTSTDILTAPWNDLAADACALPFSSGSLDALVGLDVLHHLPEPASFLSEAARVLRPGGRLRLIEPWITPGSYPVYRFMHHESCDLRVDPWKPFASGSDKQPFDGESALPWRLLRTSAPESWTRFGFDTPSVRRLNTFAYLLSLGFSSKSLLPSALVGPLLALDRATQALTPLTALRAQLEWRRR